MDMIDQGVIAAGAVIGGAAAFLVTENTAVPTRVAGVAAGAVIGAAIAKFTFEFVQEHNPILDMLR